MIVDAHHHLWDPSQRNYPWMTAEVAPIRRAFSAADLQATLPPDVVQTVVVQAVSALEESASLLKIAAQTPRIAGVVGWIDLTADAARQIAQLRAGEGGEKLVGIRHQVQDEDDPQWLLRDDVQAGLRAVGNAGLTYDLLVRPRELDAACETVRRFPALRFVLDHGAKPDIADAAREPWESGVAQLAAVPNVACKLSGLVTEARWDGWTPAQILPYARYLIDAFGAQRLLFGSDWPVCLLAASYEQVLDLARAACLRLSPPQRYSVFAGNARRFYRLPEHANDR